MCFKSSCLYNIYILSLGYKKKKAFSDISDILIQNDKVLVSYRHLFKHFLNWNIQVKKKRWKCVFHARRCSSKQRQIKGGGREERTAQLSTTMEPQEDDRCHLPPLTLETEEDEGEEKKSECMRWQSKRGQTASEAKRGENDTLSILESRTRRGGALVGLLDMTHNWHLSSMVSMKVAAKSWEKWNNITAYFIENIYCIDSSVLQYFLRVRTMESKCNLITNITG